MTDDQITRRKVVGIFRERFGVGGLLLGDDGFQFTLYDAFVVRAQADDYGAGGNWGFAVHIGADVWQGTLLGERLTLARTRDEVLDRLAIIDRWCRLRLGGAYLTARDEQLGHQR
ncbi:MAG: hypothetical protein ACTH0C_03405 [Actinomycetaceae bacterium]